MGFIHGIRYNVSRKSAENQFPNILARAAACIMCIYLMWGAQGTIRYLKQSYNEIRLIPACMSLKVLTNCPRVTVYQRKSVYDFECGFQLISSSWPLVNVLQRFVRDRIISLRIYHT